MTLGFSSLCQNRPELPHIYISENAQDLIGLRAQGPKKGPI